MTDTSGFSGLVKPETATYIKMVLYGSPGVGKTRFIGTATQDSRTDKVLLLDIEGGTHSLVGLDESIWVKPITCDDDLSRVYSELANAIQKGNNPFKLIVIDSISEYHERLLTEYVDKLADKRSGATADIDLQQADYLRALRKLQQVIFAFIKLPVHVIFISASQAEKDNSRKAIDLALAGQAPNMVVRQVGTCVYLALTDVPEGNPKGIPACEDGQYRVLVATSDKRLVTKSRLPFGKVVSDGYIYDPTMTKLLDTLGYGE